MGRSWPIAKSTLARIRSPGRTLSRPLPRAMIFSVIVMPILCLVLQPLDERVAGLRRGEVPADSVRALADADRCFDRTVRRGCDGRRDQVSHHHMRAPNRTDRREMAI